MYFWNLLTNYGDGISRESLLSALAFLIALCVALVFHEVAHGLVALWNGDDTAKRMGRLSVNPMRHFNLVGFLLMLFVGFGFANPVPVNPNNYKNKKVGSITVAIAGVLTNLLLAFLSALGVMLMMQYIGKVFLSDYTDGQYFFATFFVDFFRFMVSFNISFALFNILPLYPLDGYRLIASFVDEHNGFLTFLRRYSLYIMLALVLWDSIPVISDFSPLQLYIGNAGSWLYKVFIQFWGLFV